MKAEAAEVSAVVVEVVGPAGEGVVGAAGPAAVTEGAGAAGVCAAAALSGVDGACEGAAAEVAGAVLG